MDGVLAGFLQDAYLCWIISGLLMMVMEFAVPGFVIIFFGAGAVVTGLLLGLFPSMNVTLQLVFFTVFSLTTLFVFRRYAVGRGKKVSAAGVGDIDDDCTGRTAKVVKAIQPGDVGTVELDGTNWNAVSSVSIEEASFVKIVSRDGLTLKVEPAVK